MYYYYNKKNAVIFCVKDRGIVLMTKQYFSRSVCTSSAEAQCPQFHPKLFKKLQGVFHIHPGTCCDGYHVGLPISASSAVTSSASMPKGIPLHMVPKDPCTTTGGCPPASQQGTEGLLSPLSPTYPNCPFSIYFPFCNYHRVHCYFTEPVVNSFPLFLPLIER